MLAILTRVRQNLSAVLVSLMAKDVELFFMYLLATFTLFEYLINLMHISVDFIQYFK
jgi:hypothetical protein